MSATLSPWKKLSELCEKSDEAAIERFLEKMSSSETARVISRLSEEDRLRLFNLLAPEDAADVIEAIPESQAAEVLEEMTSEQAAAIFEELPSDYVADVLIELDDDVGAAILSKMDEDEAEEARMLMRYPTDSAGGLMAAEFLSFESDSTIQDVLEDLRDNADVYSEYNVQYVYIVDGKQRLMGVLRMHDLLFYPKDTRLSSIMFTHPLFVHDTASVNELRDFFEKHKLVGVPVINRIEHLVGVVTPAALEGEINKQKTRNFLKLSGIVGGEEFRTMPLSVRSFRRLSWLSMNIVLNMLAAGVIAFYQDTLASVIALAVFLPMVSDMSGCSGNQAIAVSMRELALGRVTPREIIWVLAREAHVGVLNGIVLGLLIGLVAYVWQGNIWVGIVVGGALAINTLVSVLLGGTLPLILKRLKLDPALVSSPLLTTITDMCGFFFVLGFASTILSKLTVS
ncbi:MAG: magnesium transporter [Deltaproteobacteria bacterium]|nr:magnesium transporter [Deltaproteobacteria bacterium]MBN2673873.1 magnesium transporter [Deltaproteobacteria bacterium]